MSTSLLYHGFGIQGYEYVRTIYEGGSVMFVIRKRPKELECSHCGSKRVIRRGETWRQFRAAPIGRKPVRIGLAIPRIGCLACGLVRQVQVNFADPRRSYTKAFERYVLDLCRSMTI